MYPEIENQIVKNHIWSPLYEAVAQLFTELGDSKRDSVLIEVGVKGQKVAPYVQATLGESGVFLLELSSNVFLEPDMSRVQRAQIDGLGWAKPNGKNPNYSKTLGESNSVETISRYIVTTLRVVFELPPNVWISFGTTPADLAVASSDSFWHRLGEPSVVCLPNNNHAETIEGIS
jgi:hypothetical protein